MCLVHWGPLGRISGPKVLGFDWLTNHYQSSPPTAIFPPVHPIAPDTKLPYSMDVKQTLQECLFKSRLKEVWKLNVLRIESDNTLRWSLTSGLLGNIAQISLRASNLQSWITIIYLSACLQQWAYWLMTPITLYPILKI